MLTNMLTAQIGINNITEIPKIKKGTTYVVMKDTSTEAAELYKQIYRKNWTFSKLAFINAKDIDKYIAPNNSFLGFSDDSRIMKVYNGTNISSTNNDFHISAEVTHLYLRLWTYSDTPLNTKANTKSMPATLTVAQIELFTDFHTLSAPLILYGSDYDGEGHIRNWGPGILQNYLKLLSNLLEQGKPRSVYGGGVRNFPELKKLEKDTLIIPEYVFTKFNKYTGDESKQLNQDKILSNYYFAYQIVSTEELNRRILENKRPFYYLVYVKSSSIKLIAVYNSLTGEMIYSYWLTPSYNIKGLDFHILSNAIKNKQ